MGKSKYSRKLFEKMLHEQQNGKPVAGICNDHGIKVDFYFGFVVVKKGYVLNVGYQLEETFLSVSKEE